MMKSFVSPTAGAQARSRRAVSSARSVVVPDRDHAPAALARAARSRRPSPAARDTTRCASRARRGRPTRTGWNVPAPTCSVTYAIAHAARAQRVEQRARRSAAPRSARRPRRARARTRSGSALRRPHRAACSMYGGSGTAPWRSSSAKTSSQSSKRSLKKPPRALEHRRFDAVGELDRCCLRAGGWLTRICASTSSCAEHALDQHLDPAAGLLAADEPRLDDARVVQHDARRSGAMQLDDVAETQVAQRTARAVEMQQPARGALAARAPARSARAAAA